MDSELINGAMSWLRDRYGEDAFSREDETDDTPFYAGDRFTSHLDDRALATIRVFIKNLIVTRCPSVLDLMAGRDSHLPESLSPCRVVGLGLDGRELEENPALTETVIHDLNGDPGLPFSEAAFDVVLNTLSVDYVTQPLDLFSEVHRVLRPGGLFLVTFTNRMFEPKAVKIWRHASEPERVVLVERYFEAAGFGTPKTFSSVGKPRPSHDRDAHLGIPSDPIYAVYACKRGGPPAGDGTAADEDGYPDEATLGARKARTRETLCCPYCDEPMKKYRLPVSPFTEWDVEFFRVCFNDECPFLRRGWRVMNEQGNYGFATRAIYIPERNAFGSVPVRSFDDLRDGIVE